MTVQHEITGVMGLTGLIGIVHEMGKEGRRICVKKHDSRTKADDKNQEYQKKRETGLLVEFLQTQKYHRLSVCDAGLDFAGPGNQPSLRERGMPSIRRRTRWAPEGRYALCGGAPSDSLRACVAIQYRGWPAM